MTVNSQRLLLAAAGEAAGEGLYVEEVFSTYVYKGTDQLMTITNGIDLANEGGLVWTKPRISASFNTHVLVDSERGNFEIRSDTTDAQTAFASMGFSSSGYVVPTNGRVNGLNVDYASWTFRKAPGFFDVVTYTGNGTAGLTIPHSLGSVPGCILVKNVSRAGADWRVWHRSLTSNSYVLILSNPNATLGEINSGAGSWNNTAPTSTNFTVGGDLDVNYNGDTYVAYLFAHDDKSFGENGNESIIKCGSFTTNGSSSATINLGFEPQWLLYKRTDANGENWQMLDVMRGWSDITSGAQELRANDSTAESTNNGNKPTSTGFKLDAGHSNNATYVYVAIRRPHKPPEAGTDVFTGALTGTPGSGGATQWRPENVDMAWFAKRGGDSKNFHVADRVRGFQSTNANSDDSYTTRTLQTNSTAAELTSGTAIHQSSFTSGATDVRAISSGSNFLFYRFKRAPGFFDCVTWSGTGSATTVSHNLTVAPELMIIKKRNGAVGWMVYHQALGASAYLFLHSNSAEGSGSTFFNATAPTASSFSVGTSTYTNASADTYIAYLFASLAGVSKVGSYTGTGSNIGVNCGFTAGARFVMIKRSDTGGTGDWYVWDSTRGIVGGNDPYLLLNSTAAEVTTTDYIDPLNSGFTVTSSAPAALNASGGTYIFLAIA